MDVTVPVEIAIDELVLRGVREADAPAVVAAFRRHLAALLAAPADVPPVGTDPLPHPPEPDKNLVAVRRTEEQEAEQLARRLAVAVARAVRR